MRSLSVMLRLAAQVLVALFAIDSVVSHFNKSYTDFSLHNRIHDSLSVQSSDSDKHDQATANPVPTENSTNLIPTKSSIPLEHQRFHEVQQSSSKPDSAYTVSSWSSVDKKIQHYTLERTYANPEAIPSQSVLFLSITRDGASWGRNPAETPRTIYSYLDFITNTTLTPDAVSLAILTSDQTEFDRYKKILTPSEHSESKDTYYNYPFQRITLVFHTAATRAPIPEKTSKEKGAGWSETADRKDRHNVAQHERRATLAKLRNYLQSVSLGHESHLLWLDSDVYKFSDVRMVQTMMEYTSTTAEREVGVLTARCRMGEPEKAEAWLKEHPDFEVPPPPKDGEQESPMRGTEGGDYEILAHKFRAQGHYDLNGWKGRRVGPNNIEQEGLWKDLASWEPHPAPDGQAQMLDGVIQNTKDDEVAQLDSVGGTVLMFRADLVRMGLNFATGYAVGMTFEHGEGYDGIETEGVCVLSRSFARDGQSMCYSLGGSWSVWHTIY